jgi:hypothetical protein
MINANINLESILCHVTDEQADGAEPYMWTSFFYLDTRTWFQRDKKVVTYTPHADWTTRGVFPNGIRAGDIVNIPASLGNYQVALDTAGLDLAMVGTIFVLLEQDSAPGGAIRAGHEAFAQAVDETLNDYMNQVTSVVDISPKPEQIQKMADQIQGRVKGAIGDAQDITDIFADQDNYFGFGYYILGYPQLESIAARAGSESFHNRIRSDVTITDLLGNTYEFVNDYEVFGEAVIVDDDQPPGEANHQYEVYKSAVDEFKSIEIEVSKTIRRLQEGPPERGELVAKLAHLRREVRPLALQKLIDARVAYVRSQGQDFVDSAAFPADSTPTRTRQFNSEHSQFFRQSALIAPPKVIDDNAQPAGE